MDEQLALTKAALITPFVMFDEATVLVKDGKILAAGPVDKVSVPPGFREVPLEGLLIAPGFIDQHVHGGGGASVMEGTTEKLVEVARFHVTHGTTTFLASTISSTTEQLMTVAKAYAGMSQKPYKGARCLGLHLEGPYLSPKHYGIHKSEALKKPDLEEVLTLHRLSNFGVKMVTLAPELPGAMEMAASLAEKRILCAIGHSDADFETAITAITNGFSSITHCFNQLRPFHHREPGVLGAALLRPELMVEVIADGIHLHPATLELVLKAKGPENIILVSDAMSPTGMPNGKYQTTEGELTLSNGSLTNQDGKLAGSVLTLERAVKNFMDMTGCELTDALRMATYNPARYLGINKRKGSLYPGKDADLVALTPDLDVVMTMVEGEVISGLISLD